MGCTQKMGYCSCKNCEKQQFEKNGPKPDFLDLDKDGNTTEPMKDAAKKAKCPHCEGNAPKSECICGANHDHMRKFKPEEYGKPTKEKIKQFCDKCGADVMVPKGTILGSNNSYYCRRCKAPNNPFTRRD